MSSTSLTIVSGGQTGADRAALDWAIEHGMPHGGRCPAGRRSEDGPIPRRYRLLQTASPSYAARTRLNVEESDATLIVSPEDPVGGTLLTLELAHKLGKPVLLVTAGNAEDGPKLLCEFLLAHKVRTLNVAGPRASCAPEVTEMVTQLLDEALGN